MKRKSLSSGGSYFFFLFFTFVDLNLLSKNFHDQKRPTSCQLLGKMRGWGTIGVMEGKG
jgi:hypothetical protein